MYTQISLHTDYNIDSVETLWTPQPPQVNWFVGGSYTFDPSNNKRSGAIILFNFSPSKRLDCKHVLNLNAGIYDLQWSPHSAENNAILSAACSDGCVRICNIYDSIGNMKEVNKIPLDSSTSSVLSVDWSKNSKLSASISNGSIAVLNSNQSLQVKWDAHDNEVWKVRFDVENDNVLYSGADDSKFKMWDTRSDVRRSKDSLLTKSFECGVCEISIHPIDANIISVGGYDQKVWFFDKRNFSEELNSIKFEGGIWRLKWNKDDPDLLLVSGMRSGYHVIKEGTMKNNYKVRTYSEHGKNEWSENGGKSVETIAYAGDWLYPVNSDVKNTVVSTSFYERELKVWDIENKLF